MEPMIAPVRRKMPLARVEQAIHLNRQFEHAVDKLESGFVAQIEADSRWAPRQGIPFPCHYCSAHKCPSHPEFVV